MTLTFEQDLEEFKATIAGGRPTDGLAVERVFAKKLDAELGALRTIVALVREVDTAIGCLCHVQPELGKCLGCKLHEAFAQLDAIKKG